jgi:hypothetical protein
MMAGFTREEAESCCTELAELAPGLSFPVTDLLPELEQRFPAGTAVWLGQQVYWCRGQRGTVAEGEPESFAKWVPRPGPVPWLVGTDGASVYVVLDDGYASWWPASWLETRP